MFGQSFVVSMVAKHGAKWLYEQTNPEASETEVKIVGVVASLGVGALAAAATVDGLGGAATIAENVPDVVSVAGDLISGDGGGVLFGSTVEFPDGTTVDNPNTDAQGNLYPTRGDYLAGTNAHRPA